METSPQAHLQVTGHRTHSAFVNSIGWGLLGGLAGTLLMDLVLIGVLPLAGQPALTCFSIVGLTIARLFSIPVITLAGGVPLGIATHYLVGPLLGGVFGAATARIKAFRVNSLKKGILLAVLYVEIFSQPILALTPILLKMTLPVTLLWFGASFIMHFIYGVVLGTVVSRGIAWSTPPQPAH